MKSFVTVALAAIGASSALAARDNGHMKLVKKATANGPTDVEILNYALTLEHLEKNFYFQGLQKFKAADFTAAGFSANTHHEVQRIAIQEKAHVAFLKGALGSAGVAECKYDFGGAFDSVAAFVATARIFEGVGTAAYLGAAPDISSKAYLAAAGSILTIEARHTSWLNTVNGATGFPTTFESGLDYAQVYSLVAPYIVANSCGKNGDLPPSIKQFPALTLVTKTPRAGHTTALAFKRSNNDQLYAAFVNGGAIKYEPITLGADKVDRVTVPAGLEGVTYIIVTSSKNALADDNTQAGPAIAILSSPSP